ncbi:MAG: hypothetical protein ACE37F_18140 [Nannocystaceae bacterium]|nr:hypothetical protein [bacterium]
MNRTAFVIPLLLPLACDDPTGPEAGNATEVGTSGADGAESSTTSGEGGPQSGETTTTSEADSDDTGGAETSSGGAMGESSTGVQTPAPDYATPHFPLQVGLQWSYRLTRTDGTIGESCIDDGSIHVMRMTDEQAGVFTRTEEPWCYFDALQFRVQGEYVDVNSGAWYHQLLLPPERGATWAAGGASGATYVWDAHHASYTVEAGTFEDCWRRTQQGYDVWEIYCRDVGMVESHYDAWGSNTRSELVAFEG